MSEDKTYSINVGGQLFDLGQPCVMGILNATPDSFYVHHEGEEVLRSRVRQIMDEGAAIIDVGACSTRPGCELATEEQEMERLREALTIVHEEAPDAIISVDTFRASVAKRCVEDYGVHIINDISEGNLDADMFQTVADLHVPYILTHCTPHPESDASTYMAAVVRQLGSKVEQLHELGVADIILDPGFGFGKTLSQNYQLMAHLSDLQVLDLPVLVGISRKSMILRLMETSPAEALGGTNVLHAYALERGAAILRAHDVKDAVTAITIVNKLNACRK